MNAANTPKIATPTAQTDWLAIVEEKVRGLRFGVVQIVVHDARVVQIERTEKTRLEPDGSVRKGGESC